MTIDEEAVFGKAIGKWGADEQMRVAQEECAELIQALSKYHRSLSRNQPGEVEACLANIKEEMTDVQIMLDQLRSIFGFNDFDLNAIRTAKVNRLREVLSAEDK